MERYKIIRIMAGTYKVTEILKQTNKFACLVSFNGKNPEYYELDADHLDREIVSVVAEQEQLNSELSRHSSELEAFRSYALKEPNEKNLESLSLKEKKVAALELAISDCDRKMNEVQRLLDDPTLFVNITLQKVADEDEAKNKEVNTFESAKA